MIGAGIAFAVADIVKGRCSVEEVECIFSDMNFDNSNSQEIGAFYKKYFWSEFPEKAEAVYNELLAAGKIRQPKSMKYGKRMTSWPCPLWYKTYAEYRARQMKVANVQFIELLEVENLHRDLA